MTTNQPTNLDKGTIQIDHTATDRGQRITTRLRTKEIPVTITNRIPKAKTNNNNKKQLQQLQMKYKAQHNPTSTKRTIWHYNNTGNTNSTRNTNTRDNTILIPFSIDGYKKSLPNPKFYTWNHRRNNTRKQWTKHQRNCLNSHTAARTTPTSQNIRHKIVPNELCWHRFLCKRHPWRERKSNSTGDVLHTGWLWSIKQIY